MNKLTDRLMTTPQVFWKFALLPYLLVAVACASTSLSGIVDPNYRGNFQAKRIVIMSSGFTLSQQRALENTIEKRFIKHQVEVLRGLEMFPPTRTYTVEEIYNISQNRAADAILIITASDHNVSTSYTQETYHPGQSTSHISVYGNSAIVSTTTSPGYTTGGYEMNKPSMNVAVQLKNTKNRETIWTAEGFSGGNAFASFSSLTKSVAKKTVKVLSREGLIPERMNRTENF